MKKCFQLYKLRPSLGLEILRFYSCCYTQFRAKQRPHFDNETFLKILFWKFTYVPTLRKKVFSMKSVKLFSLGLKVLRFFFFANPGLRKIKDHSLRKKNFRKYILEYKFYTGACLLWIMVFWFLRIRFGNDQRSSFKYIKFWKIWFAIEILGKCMPTVERYF